MADAGFDQPKVSPVPGGTAAPGSDEPLTVPRPTWSAREALRLGTRGGAAVLGAISPVAATMALEIGKHTGRTVGSVYSWGAVGSIVGGALGGRRVGASPAG